MSPNPQSWKEGKLVDLPRHDNDIGQKYVFSAIESDKWEQTYQLNNLMELTNRVLLNTEEILKSGTSSSTGIIVPEPIDNREIMSILSQTKASINKIEETVDKLSADQKTILTDPNTTWTQRLHIVLSKAVESVESYVIIAALGYIDALPWFVNNIRKVIFRRTGNYNFESPVIDPQVDLTRVIAHGGEL